MRNLRTFKALIVSIPILLVFATVCGLLLQHLLFSPQKSKQPSESVALRQALTNNELRYIALVDESDPLPATEGKDITFIDGAFLTRAPQAVCDLVILQMEACKPVVVFGEGFNTLYQLIPPSAPDKSLSIRPLFENDLIPNNEDLPKHLLKQGLDKAVRIPTAAKAVKMIPVEEAGVVDLIPHSYSIAGSIVDQNVVDQAIRWSLEYNALYPLAQ
ncbi:MAG: hypothetical protein SVY53_13960 [Chloroflexota bacterium]|nr:hypothetical protein [Chloroflexota bacterium]